MFEPLGLGHGETGFLGRDTKDPLLESWILQTDQFQKQIPTMSNKSFESLSSFSLTSGEYISIHLKPWIISTTKEKEVTTLHFGQLGPSSKWELGCLGNWDLWTIGDSWIILDPKDAQNKNKVWGFFRNLQGD